ncbi:MAG: hypothetical protein AAFU85_05270 [Planctomycetota bacterium]
MIRSSAARYKIIRVFDETSPPPQRLGSTRTLEFAPWNPNEFYTGGYDGAANQRKNQNTAWIAVA